MSVEVSKPLGDDYDSPWKEALEHYFPEFLALLFAEIHAEVDWTRGYEFLDKELQQVVRDAELGRRFADKLVKVCTRDGKETWVLVHVEVQGQAERGFDERMYVYNYRLFDRYRVDVVSLAVLADASPGFHAGDYRRVRWGCEVRFRFPAVKLLELGRDWEALESSTNPFALVVMAQLKAHQSRDGAARKDVKLHLVRLMYRRGYAREQVLELFRVIDWLLQLPAELEIEFEQALMALEEEEKMPYITSIERMGMERGMQQGMQQGVQLGEVAVLRKQLQHKFGDQFTEAYRKRLDSADTDMLLLWSEQLLGADTIDEVFH